MNEILKAIPLMGGGRGIETRELVSNPYTVEELNEDITVNSIITLTPFISFDFDVTKYNVTFSDGKTDEFIGYIHNFGRDFYSSYLERWPDDYIFNSDPDILFEHNKITKLKQVRSVEPPNNFINDLTTLPDFGISIYADGFYTYLFIPCFKIGDITIPRNDVAYNFWNYASTSKSFFIEISNIETNESVIIKPSTRLARGSIFNYNFMGAFVTIDYVFAFSKSSTSSVYNLFESIASQQYNSTRKLRCKITGDYF